MTFSGPCRGCAPPPIEVGALPSDRNGPTPRPLNTASAPSISWTVPTRKTVAFGPPDRDGHRLPPPVRAHRSSAPLKTVTVSASPHGCRERIGKGVGKSRWRQGKSSRTVRGPTRAARHRRDKNGRLGVLTARSAPVRSDSQEKIGAQWRGWGEKRGHPRGEQLSPRDTEWSRTLGEVVAARSSASASFVRWWTRTTQPSPVRRAWSGCT